jgi:uncharacterized protein YbjT (DUF2867 family)
MYAITGASGQLGRLTIEKLLASVPAGQIVAAVRNPNAVKDLAARGSRCGMPTTMGPIHFRPLLLA